MKRQKGRRYEASNNKKSDGSLDIVGKRAVKGVVKMLNEPEINVM